MTHIPKFVLLARYSSKLQDATSCDRQLDLGRGEVLRREGEVIGEFQDNAVSGGKIGIYRRGPKTGQPKRPGLQEALDLCRKHKATLVVYDLFRLSRHLPDSLEIVRVLNESGAGIITLTGFAIDTTTAHGELIFHIIASVGHFFRKHNTEVIKAAMHHHQKNGRAMGGTPRYGMMFDPDNFYDHPEKGKKMRLLIKCPAEQKIIKLIVRLRGEDKNFCDIARALMIRRVPSRAKCGKRWNNVTVKKILEREGAV